jgi:hypothetical protein
MLCLWLLGKGPLSCLTLENCQHSGYDGVTLQDCKGCPGETKLSSDGVGDSGGGSRKQSTLTMQKGS